MHRFPRFRSNFVSIISVSCPPLRWSFISASEAMDRIHRLGQYRPVKAIKLVIEDSIESRIVQVGLARCPSLVPSVHVLGSCKKRNQRWWTQLCLLMTRSVSALVVDWTMRLKLCDPGDGTPYSARCECLFCFCNRPLTAHRAVTLAVGFLVQGRLHWSSTPAACPDRNLCSSFESSRFPEFGKFFGRKKSFSLFCFACAASFVVA
jgi:hypothetical protein